MLKRRNNMSDLFRKEYRELSDTEKSMMERIKVEAEALVTSFDFASTEASGREFALARTKLEECIMWAIKGLTK